MNINASIIDQRLTRLAQDIALPAQEELHIQDTQRLHSLAFVYLCVQTLLDLDAQEAFDCLTEGGGDFGVDALHMDKGMDGELYITLFQAKYKHNLKGDSHFPQTGIDALANAVGHIFDPSSHLGAINPRLLAKVEQVRSLVRDGFIPHVRVLACNNGLPWNADAQTSIDRNTFGEQVVWEHVNHDVLIALLQRPKGVNTLLRLTGEALVENMNFSRVCIGRISVLEVCALMEQYGEKLLERNIRRYLGLYNNRVNEEIKNTLSNPQDADNFYFFNNGLTVVCKRFRYNALQGKNHQIPIEGMQIVNGGQTCMTILKTAQTLKTKDEILPYNASILLRIYELPDQDDDIVTKITQTTNNQSAVEFKDLRSNDSLQKNLELSLKDLGYHYRRKRSAEPLTSTDITPGAAAEAVLSVWRKQPHRAKFFAREHFGKLYHTIFNPKLTAVQVVVAILLYRIAENHRRRPQATDPQWVRYASCFIAMRMGGKFLENMKMGLDDLHHKNFNKIIEWIEGNGENCFQDSLQDVDAALRMLYHKKPDISMQQLSATFRRGDLIEKLDSISYITE